MLSRTALVLETNPVITERYLDYTHDSDWRIMLKDTLNDFLEKLQQEKFNLIVAEESLLPQGIIQMMKSTGIPFLLSTNNKNPEIPTLPRNFNRTELLTVFNRLVPVAAEEQPAEDSVKEDEAVKDLLSGLEDEEDAFELTSDAVILEPELPHEEKDEKPAFERIMDEETKLRTALETPEKNDDANNLLFEDTPDNDFKADDTGEYNLETTEVTMNQLQNDSLTEDKTEETQATSAVTEPASTENNAKTEVSGDMIKSEVSAWLEKNARSIIKEIVLEQLASLSGKNND